MITYVNSVFVSNTGNVASSLGNLAKGDIIFFDIDKNKASLSNDTNRFKIGMATGKNLKQINPKTGAVKDVPEIKWSNIINVADIKNIEYHTNGNDTEDKIYINFDKLDDAMIREFGEGGKRIIVRLTFKDLPTRFRKWTESYEYVTNEGATESASDKENYKDAMVKDIVNMINKEYKRARVIASAVVATTDKDGNVSYDENPDESDKANAVLLTAMKYDDDDSVDSINWYNKVRFNANLYYTDPAAEGWESLNKHFPKGVVISKEPGHTDSASAKLVRDREAQAMGYLGILNRGEGTWPIIKPAMETDLSKTYNSVTIEFENMYRAADDIFRKTKQSVEIYTVGTASGIKSVLSDKLGI